MPEAAVAEVPYDVGVESYATTRDEVSESDVPYRGSCYGEVLAAGEAGELAVYAVSEPSGCESESVVPV